MIDIEKIIESTQRLTLLYVEDNTDAREATLLILEDIFKEIITAVDGEDGLVKFKENKEKIDLVLTDINMPNMDGLDMSDKIKQINDDIPIIILTALTDISILKKAIDIGIDSFLNKPLDDLDILFHKLDVVSKKLDYEKAQEDKEKARSILTMIQKLSHHWKQPLSVISTISSGCTMKIENNIPLSESDLKNLALITKKVDELSAMFIELEKLNFENISIEDIEKITHISKEIY